MLFALRNQLRYSKVGYVLCLHWSQPNIKGGITRNQRDQGVVYPVPAYPLSLSSLRTGTRVQLLMEKKRIQLQTESVLEFHQFIWRQVVATKPWSGTFNSQFVHWCTSWSISSCGAGTSLLLFSPVILSGRQVHDLESISRRVSKQ